MDVRGKRRIAAAQIDHSRDNRVMNRASGVVPCVAM
jgi:hypothetical protein